MQQLSAEQVITRVLAGQEVQLQLKDLYVQQYKEASRSVAEKLREDPEADHANWEPKGLPMTQVSGGGRGGGVNKT